MDVAKSVIELKEKHSKTWRDKPESYWLARLMQEVGELGSSLVGDHDEPVDWELMQISTICMNWIEMRNPQSLPTQLAADVLPQCEKCGSSFLWSNDGSAVCCNPECGTHR